MNRLSILIVLLLLFSFSANAQGYRRSGDDYKKFRLAFQGGWSYRTAKLSESIPPLLKDYFKGIKTGYNYGASATFFFNRSFGAGIEYSAFKSGNRLDGLTATDTVTLKTVTGSLKDDITISFIGPSFTVREVFGEKDNFHFWGSFCLGYLSYKDDAVFFTPETITGSTAGGGLSLGFDIGLTDNIFIGAQFNYLGGALSKLTYKDASGSSTVELKDEERENISRLDVSGGIRFNF